MHVSDDMPVSRQLGDLAAAAIDKSKTEVSEEGCLNPQRRAELQSLGQSVSLLVEEMVRMVGGTVPSPRDSRRRNIHVRQIAMYLCHVSLRITLTDVGLGFGRDRSTVAHACAVVEDRRDAKAYDEFLSSLERVTSAVFAGRGEAVHEE